MKGWIKLHRKLLSSDIFQNEKLLKVFIYCLLKSSHNGHSQRVGLKTLELKEGQFIYGRNRAAEELNMSASSVRNYIEVLVNEKMLDSKTTNKFSIITVMKWGFYQGEEEKEDSKITTKGQQNNSKITTRGQQNNTNKNVKNVKNEKNNNTTPQNREKNLYSEENTYFKMASYFHKKVTAVAKEAGVEHLTKKSNLQKWADEFRLLVKKDKVEDNTQIRNVMDWVTTDDFWKTNILSAKKFREKYADLAIKMKSSQNLSETAKLSKTDPRDKEIKLQQWIQEGNDPNEFDWGKQS